MLGADDDGQSRAVDVFIQQLDQSLLFFNHFQQSVQRAECEPSIFTEQRRRAVDVELALLGQIGERGRSQPHRPREQRVVQQPLLVHPFQHRFPRAMERQPAELGVEVVGRLAQFVSAERFADLDDLLDDMSAASDDDDQDAAGARAA